MRLWIPDNLTSAVTRACRYEPTVQRDYQELAEHYGAAILPARPYKPRDKAKVEVAVQIEEDKLRPLPKDSLELSETKEAKVQIDSHVAFRGTPIRPRCLGLLRLTQPIHRIQPSYRFTLCHHFRAITEFFAAGKLLLSFLSVQLAGCTVGTSLLR
ncbi:MAG: hypothetical protein JNM83_08545 [Myxococcales bacterium]|nr:hypothetical protein [Myxococcales bacterium]